MSIGEWSYIDSLLLLLVKEYAVVPNKFSSILSQFGRVTDVLGHVIKRICVLFYMKCKRSTVVRRYNISRVTIKYHVTIDLDILI